VRAAGAASSAEELVRQAQAHEAAHDDDVAVRRYMEALTIDATSANAWLGLGALRLRLGDAAEAEKVYSAAIEHVPSLHRALEGRARARWALGQRALAEHDIDEYVALDSDPAGLKELADWYGREGRTPAQLAIWRRVSRLAMRLQDASLAQEARRMVRALVIVVDGADPASSPIAPDETRRALAAIARRGG
jgi:tetratricopeptide (TPR) repeat protein